MFTIPADEPETTPVAEPTVANVILLLLQLPPVVPSVSVVDDPAHTFVVPAIPIGNGLTVTTTVAEQPDQV